MAYTIRVLGQTAWIDGITDLATAGRERWTADRVCQPGHRVLDTDGHDVTELAEDAAIEADCAND